MLDRSKELVKRSYEMLSKAPVVAHELFALGSRVWEFAKASDDRKQELANELVRWASRKAAEIEFRHADGSAKGFAEHLLQSSQPFASRLGALLHFGALEEHLLGNVSRLEYTKLILQSLLDLKNHYPGLGLGSKNRSIQFKNNKLTGLEVTQAFAILSNCGHLFGTFATERGLMIALTDDNKARREFLSAVDNGFLDYADHVLVKRNLYQFHYLLSVLFVSRLERSALRRTCLEVLREILVKKPEKLLWVLRVARQVSYNRIHSLSQMAFSYPSQQCRLLLSEARSSVGVEFIDRQHEQSAATRLLDAVDEYQTSTVFTSPPAVSIVVRHVDDLLSWWHSREAKRSVVDRIADLARKPPDWPATPEGDTLNHFVRIRLPKETDWIAETRSMQSTPEIWDKARFLLTPLPRGNVVLLDLFFRDVPTAQTLNVVASRLSRQTVASWVTPPPEWAQEIWQSNIEFALAVLQQVTLPEYRLVLSPTVTGSQKSIGFGMFSGDLEAALGRMQRFEASVSEESRIAELRGLRERIRKAGPLPDHAYLFVALGNVSLVAVEDNTRAGELDGIFAHFTPTDIRWFLYEHKRGDAVGEAAGQLQLIAKKLTMDLEELWRGRPDTGGKGVLLGGVSHKDAD